MGSVVTRTVRTLCLLPLLWLGGCMQAALPPQASSDTQRPVVKADASHPVPAPSPSAPATSGFPAAEPVDWHSRTARDGAFRFLPGQWIPIGASSGELISVVSGDIDGDGRDDIVMAARFNGTTDTGKPTRFLVIRQSASGTLLPILELPYPRSFMFTTQVTTAVVDIDHDGRKDVLLATGSGFLILKYVPGSGFTIVEPAGAGGCSRMALVDIDLDGNPDAACLGDRHLSLLLGDGAGGFVHLSGTDLMGDGWVDLKVADVNGDGFADLLVLRDHDVAELLIFPHDGVDGFGLPESYPMPDNVDGLPYGLDLSDRGMSAGDFNGDGRTDLAVSTTRRVPALFHVLYGNPGSGGPPFITREVALPGGGPSAFTVADFDRDGNDDIFISAYMGPGLEAAFVEQRDGRLIVGEGVSSALPPPYDQSNSTAVGDVNGDGCQDVVAVDGFNLWINLSEGCFRRETGGRGTRRKR